MTEDLFANTNDQTEFDPNKNYVEELVGEGKKYSDPNKLAYSRQEADRFIDRLKTENEAMRKDITARQRLEELVTKLSTLPPTNQQTNQSTSNENNQDSQRDGVQGLTPEQAENLFNQKLTERENFNRSLTGLKTSIGPDYQPKLDAEAKRLGLTTQEVNNLAKTNPDLFLQVFGQSKTETTDISSPSTSFNSAAISRNNGQRTEKYYKDLKNRDPKTYWSKQIQQQEYQDAMKMGAAYFDV